MTAPMDVKALLALVDEYWDLAYAEGAEGRDHDTEAGDAQRVRSQIETLVAALVADGERYRYVREHPSVVVEEWGVAWEEPTAIDRKVDAARSGKGEGNG